ncbi:MAG: flagellar hook-associated protein FlgK [Xanthomonadales bacterium]|nr:flagellar hook-associated protein FlgK [Xanthomonadales bacterium]
MADLLNLGAGSLLSLQRAISTTGHNIANVNTEGYSRQRVEFATRPPQFLGGSYIGNGVTIDSIDRVYDEYLAADVRDRTSSQARFDTYYSLSARLDGLMADPAVGLGPVLAGFFGAVQDVANNPGSLPERQVMLAEAQALADRFHYLDANFRNLDDEVNGRIEATVGEINALAEGIADLNRQITSAASRAAGAGSPDLLDARDRLVVELASKINVTTVAQSDGSLNVTIGNGQPLVVGLTAEQLQTGRDPEDPTQTIVGILNPAGELNDLERFLGGGELGALLDFRSQTLNYARNQLGLVAVGVTSIVNEQHALGIDLNGQPGGDFFLPLEATQTARQGNSGLSSVTATIDDTAALTGDDYSVVYAGGQWTLTNLTTGAFQAGPGPFSVDGLTIDVAGAPVDGDAFTVQPTRQGATLFAVALNDAAGIAAAAPLRGQAELANTGSGDIGDLVVNDTAGLPLAGPVTLTFNPNALGPGVPGYDVAGIAGGPLAYDPGSESNGKTFTLGGFNVTVNGIPQAGDELTIENNTGASGDNRNALALASLQTGRELFGGTASFQDAYGSLVADIGVQTRQAQTGSETESVLLEQAIAARDSVSGVNLDEEAANLIRFQQAYQAAAQFISVADQVFQTLLDATRR